MTIDTSLSNAARIIKLPGTMARKGDDIPSRPHRWSEVISSSDNQIVSVEFLEGFATEHAPVSLPPDRITARSYPVDVDRRNWGSPRRPHRTYVFAPGFPDSIAGQNGFLGRLYHVACVLVDGFGLTRERGVPILHEWNQAKAEPRESEKQLVHKIESAMNNHPIPSLKLLNAGHLVESSARNATRGNKADERDNTPIIAPEWPALPDDAAYQGLAGKILQTIDPETEPDSCCPLDPTSGGIRFADRSIRPRRCRRGVAFRQ